uniref:Uncharacterized protein n=1 Tax=Plectus sambesii TaxID=2011161 RepID=A0A914WMG3_9BILA
MRSLFPPPSPPHFKSRQPSNDQNNQPHYDKDRQVPSKSKITANDTTYQRLRVALNNKLVTKDTQAYVLRTLAASKQMPNESFAEYVLAIQLAFDSASPELRSDGDAIEAIRMYQLMDAICIGATDDISTFLIDKAPIKH